MAERGQYLSAGGGQFERIFHLVYIAGITTLLDAGLGGKAEELFKKLQKSNSKLSKEYEKLFKALNKNGVAQKVIDNRVKKVNQAAKELGKDAAKALGAKLAEETRNKAGDEIQKKIRHVKDDDEKKQKEKSN